MTPIALILGFVLSLASQKTADPSTYAGVVPTLQPGETLTLAAGTYVGNLNLNNLRGTPSAWITVQGPASLVLYSWIESLFLTLNKWFFKSCSADSAQPLAEKFWEGLICTETRTIMSREGSEKRATSSTSWSAESRRKYHLAGMGKPKP